MMTQMIKRDIDEIASEFESELKSLEGKTIFITGGNGFILSYIVDVIAEFNKKLITPCRMIIMNKNPVTEKSRLGHLINDKNIKFLAHDAGKPFEVIGNPNIIIHAASRANPKSFLEDPIDTINANVNGIRTLLEYTKENGVENFLFFSSGEVYGNPPPEYIPTPEAYSGNVDSLGSRACYAESKRFCETLCMAFYRQHKVPVKILRIFHTYGPGLRDDGKAITEFFSQARTKKLIQLKDRGEARIAFCYVADLVRGIFKVMFQGNSGEAYNIGNNSEIPSIKELAEMIGRTLNNGTEVRVNESAIQNYKISIRCPDLSKMGKLGYAPKVLLEDGLKRMVRHYQENPECTAP